ncbi:MAG: cysteine hydrolase [Candidatus Aenigmarchaeota archaeon]|nr:cysteine hydrolase [Candidatus Aenigmarchaeota archaeon]
MKPAVIVVDMQKDIVLGGPYHSKMALGIVPKIKELLEFARERKIPVVFLRYVIKADRSNAERFEPKTVRACSEGTEGAEIIEELKPERGEFVVDRNRHNGFLNSNLGKILEKLKADCLVFAGVNTNICVRATAMEGYYRDYETVIVKDCTGTSNKKTHEFTLKDMENITYGMKVFTEKEFERWYNGKI